MRLTHKTQKIQIYLFNASSTSSRLLKLRSATDEYEARLYPDIFILI